MEFNGEREFTALGILDIENLSALAEELSRARRVFRKKIFDFS